MEFTEKTIEKAFKEMMKNLFWKDMYDNAPEGAKKRLRVAFWGAKYMDEGGEGRDAYRERRAQIEQHEMTAQDAQYLADNFPDDTAGKTHYRELAVELRLRPMRTPEKLDRAIDGMIAAMSDYEREMVEKTRTIMRNELKDDPVFSYVDFWKAVGGDPEQALLAGDMFDHGHGTERDEALAFFWFRKAALCGSGEACYRLANILEDEHGAHYDFDAALFWWSEGVRRDSESVKAQLGYRLTFGEGPWEKRRNPQQGVGLLTTCLEHDEDGYAHYFLGKCFMEGVGVEKNTHYAIHLLCIARRRKHPGAPELLKKLRDEEKRLRGEEKELKDEKKEDK